MSIKDTGDYIIVVDHINKTFPNGVKALVDFTTKVHRGEVVVVIGPSGSGKSTFLRCLNHLETATSGHIIIDGNTAAGLGCMFAGGYSAAWFVRRQWT